MAGKTNKPTKQDPSAVKEKNKQQSLENTLAAIDKAMGKGTVMCGPSVVPGVEFLSIQSPSINKILGGGLAKGRIAEVFGPESSGKTTLTLHAIAEVHKNGGVAAFIDAEHALDINYAAALGVDTDNLLISQPDSGEQALDVLEMLTRSAAVDLIVIDSVAALIPRAEIEGDMGDSHMGLQARLMSQAMRKLKGLAYKSGTTLVFINQLRMKIGIVFGNPETTTGGNALKFYASQRIDIRRKSVIKDNEEIVGNETRVKCVKNKVASPFKECIVQLRYGMGIDIMADTLQMAVDSGIVDKAGAWYSYKGEQLGQGFANTRQALLDNGKLLAEITELVSKL